MTLALLLLTIVPHEAVARETVDLIEVNHFYDGDGRLVFAQDIFYDWSKDDARYMVRAWRLVKQPGQLPKLNRRTGMYECEWFDGEGLIRVVSAPSFRETWTQWDVELAEREWLPKERRKELTTIRQPVKRRVP